MGEKRYPVSDEKKAEVENTYTHHPPTPEQIERYKLIREKAKEYQYLILELTPPGDAQDRASKKIEESVMLANAAIARGEHEEQ